MKSVKGAVNLFSITQLRPFLLIIVNLFEEEDGE
jgi:hypothetical protein